MQLKLILNNLCDFFYEFFYVIGVKVYLNKYKILMEKLVCNKNYSLFEIQGFSLSIEKHF